MICKKIFNSKSTVTVNALFKDSYVQHTIGFSLEMQKAAGFCPAAYSGSARGSIFILA
ncbi:MAG: hypothetical protein HZA50_17505 [Planctomycetes bacterium]|nr:hypothetical protein [Planctomycetota bacterium]